MTCKYCRERVLRRDVERHERLSCEEVPGSCEFQAVGCNHDKVAIQFTVDGLVAQCLVHISCQLIKFLSVMLSESVIAGFFKVAVRPFKLFKATFKSNLQIFAL